VTTQNLRRALCRAAFLPLVIVAIFSALMFSGCKKAAEKEAFQYAGQRLPAQNPAAEFQLTDQDGNPFSLQAARGRMVIMFFGFTHCPNVCPTTLARVSAIVHGLPEAMQRKTQVLFITLDPERDSPQVLKGYVPFFDPKFIGLTGSPEEIARVAKAYGVTYERAMQTSQVAANNYTINHSTYTYVIDPAGNFALIYDDKDLLNGDAVTRDLEHLMNETLPQ